MKASTHQTTLKLRQRLLPLTFIMAYWLFLPPLLYAQTAVLTETFSTKTLPAGWQVIPEGKGDDGWVFNDPHGRATDWHLSTGDFALADGFRGRAITTELRAPVLNLTGRPAVTLKFKTYFYTSSGSADVDVSTDNGNVWTTVWSQATNLNAVPFKEQTVDLSKSAGNQASVILRFRANNMKAVWMVDDVKVDAPAVPMAPTNLTAALGQNSVVNLSWQGEDTAKFDVERSTDGTTWQKLTDNSMSAKSYIDSSVASSTAYQYRVRATNAAGTSDYSDTATVTTTDRSVITYDIIVSYYDTYANTVPTKQTAIEDNIKYLADAVYEMSNGAQKLGQVTIYTDGAVKDRADIIWQKDAGDTGELCWFNAYTGGRTVEKGPGKRIQHCDIGKNYPQYDTLSNPKTGGYTLGHEWGHYFFGLFDEYAQGPASSTDPGDPLSTDAAVQNALMNDSSGALQGDYSWLNFSTSLNNKGSNAQFRKYGASAWDTVTRPSEQDPASVGFKRPYYPELKTVAPPAGQAPSIELSSSGASTAARSALKINWKKGADAPATRARPGSQSVATVRAALIDYSSAVSSVRLAEVKGAIQQWIDSANIGDYLTIIKFDGTPTVVQPLIQIDGQATKDAIVTAIAGITSSNNLPALGDALRFSLAQFTANNNAPSELVRAVYLFSNGQSLTGTPPFAMLPGYHDGDVMLHIFDLGENDSTTAMLQQLAKDTGGQYWRSNTFEQLEEGLDNADQATSPTVDVAIKKGNDTVVTAKDFQFYVDPSIGGLDVATTYGGDMTAATLTLVEPTGNTHSFTDTDCDTVNEGQGKAFQQTSCELAIDSPSSGTWTLKVATNLSSLDFSYRVNGLPTNNDATLFASVESLNGEELEYPQPLLLTASVGKDQAITGVGTTAKVTLPNGSVQDLTFHDDGVAPDVDANDGRYTAQLDYTISGDYSITVGFNNNAGTAKFTNYGISYVPDPTGKIPERRLVPIGENFERVADSQVTVMNAPASQYDTSGKFIGLVAATPIVTPPVTTTPGTTTPPVTSTPGTTTPPVVTPPVAVSSAVTDCAMKGTVSNFCNANGATLKDVKIEAPANVTQAMLTGQIDNQGWISNSTIQKDATLTGGTLTGYITNKGTIADIQFVGATLEGGTLSGTITNASRVGGTIKNVHFAANAKLTGGVLAGEIQGDCKAPAQLDNLTVKAGSHLACVTVGKNVVLGKGVKVESLPTTTPSTPPTGEKKDLPSLGDGVATDAKGKTVTTTAKLAGGVSVNDAKTFGATAAATAFTDRLNIQGNITVDAKHIKQTADLVVSLTYQAIATDQPVYLMLDSKGNYLPWNQQPASLVAFRTGVSLSAEQPVEIYQGVLLATGLVKITFGYRLADGTLVQSPKEIELTLSGGHTTADTSTASSAKVLTETDNGKTIELSTGQTLKVTLASNPTTGYIWEKVFGEETVIKPIGEPAFVSDPNPSGAVGVGGKTTFTLEAAEMSDETTLKLVYHRPWESTLPIQTFEVKVVVK
jgi:predicted secreted protein